VGADVEIDDPSLSRRHAELVASGSTWVLRDLGSTNGTWVADRRLAAGEAAEIAPEVSIRLGSVAAIIRPG
jgi:pSer/pThr/pTyr-binding forkhead associated (FHA) protein